MESVLRGEEFGKRTHWPQSPARLEGKGKEEKKGYWDGVARFGACAEMRL